MRSVALLASGTAAAGVAAAVSAFGRDGLTGGLAAVALALAVLTSRTAARIGRGQRGHS